MPIKSAAAKALRQNIKHRQRNLAIRGGVKRAVKAVRKTVREKDATKSAAALAAAIQRIDRAYAKGVLKRNTAARLKSRLSLAVRRASA